MFYDFGPTVHTFYDFSGIESENLRFTKDLDLEKTDYQGLKNHIGVVIIRHADSIVRAELKVISYIDLVAKVAGIPSFLFLVYRFFLSHFETFYSNLKVC